MLLRLPALEIATGVALCAGGAALAAEIPVVVAVALSAPLQHFHDLVFEVLARLIRLLERDSKLVLEGIQGADIALLRD